MCRCYIMTSKDYLLAVLMQGLFEKPVLADYDSFDIIYTSSDERRRISESYIPDIRSLVKTLRELADDIEKSCIDDSPINENYAMQS